MEKWKFFIFVLLFVPASVFAVESIKPWTVRGFWGRLEARMTEQQAAKLLGEPLETEDIHSNRIWYYSEPPERQGEKFVSRPKTGFLIFKQSPNDPELYLLIKWSEPDWTTILPLTEKQYQDHIAQIEKQMETEQARLKQQEILKQRQDEAEKHREKANALKQKQIEDAQKHPETSVIQKQESHSREHIESAHNQSSNLKKKNGDHFFTQHYWFLAGAFMVVSATVISFTYGFRKH